MNIICPHCKKENLNSLIYIDKFYEKTIISIAKSFYDENGKKHIHDQNEITSYTCSNDHKFKISKIKTCWCGWPNKQ